MKLTQRNLKESSDFSFIFVRRMLEVLFTVMCTVLVAVPLTRRNPNSYAREARLNLDLSIYRNYRKSYEFMPFTDCIGTSEVKAYMPYTAITDTTSNQYRYIKDNMTADTVTGLLVDKYGFIGAALGYKFGDIGSRYYFTLDTGIILPLVKIDEKAAKDAPDGCTHGTDGSTIELVIDEGYASSYFGIGNNGYILNGSFNNYECFVGKIVSIDTVSI